MWKYLENVEPHQTKIPRNLLKQKNVTTGKLTLFQAAPSIRLKARDLWSVVPEPHGHG